MRSARKGPPREGKKTRAPAPRHGKARQKKSASKKSTRTERLVRPASKPPEAGFGSTGQAVPATPPAASADRTSSKRVIFSNPVGTETKRSVSSPANTLVVSPPIPEDEDTASSLPPGVRSSSQPGSTLGWDPAHYEALRRRNPSAAILALGNSGIPPAIAISAGNTGETTIHLEGRASARAGTSIDLSGTDDLALVTTAQAQAMRAQLVEIRALLLQARPLAVELDKARAPGIGHNQPPPDAQIPSVTEDVTAAVDATAVIEAEISTGSTVRRSVLRTCGYVLKSVLERIDAGLSTLMKSTLSGAGVILGAKFANEIWPTLQPLVQNFITHHLQPLLQ